jgi:hypothetical protein
MQVDVEGLARAAEATLAALRAGDPVGALQGRPLPRIKQSE